MALVVGTSFTMQLIQRRQRRNLRRRIANGEVDLEALGIKRMNVPQEQIDKMPKYTFNVQPEGGLKVPPVAAKTQARHNTMYQQATCAICLDDFVHDETSVRELPCNHIFHPECIDPFLRDNSSLCPLCKKTALPAGFCPVAVTNIMVRRERLTRRVREGRRAAMQGYLQNRMGGSALSSAGRTRTSAIVAPPISIPEVVHGPATETGTELGPIEPQPETRRDSEEPPPEVARQGIAARRAWRRERLARQHSQEFDQSGVEARRADETRPLWRRMMGLA